MVPKIRLILFFAGLFVLSGTQGSSGDERSLKFYHTHTGKSLQVTYYTGGRYLPAAMTELSVFLADWRDGKQRDMDPELMNILWRIQQISTNKEAYEVISAYRSEETNALLHSKSKGVAKNSQHVLGKAIDVRLRGLDLERLRETARDLRLGGVGYYPGSDFVHVDTGRFVTGSKNQSKHPKRVTNKMRTGFLAQTLILTTSLLLAPVCSSAAEKNATPEVNRDIEALLNSKSLVIDGVEILTRPILLEVYADHGFEPYWTQPGHVQELMDLVDQSADHGLDPADYNVLLLHRLVLQQSRSPSAQLEAEEEILLMESLLRYGYHRRYGKVKANSLDPDINFRRELFHDQPPSVTIEQALGASSLADFIQMVAADGPVYRHLQDALDRYRDIAEAVAGRR